MPDVHQKQLRVKLSVLMKNQRPLQLPKAKKRKKSKLEVKPKWKVLNAQPNSRQVPAFPSTDVTAKTKLLLKYPLRKEKRKKAKLYFTLANLRALNYEGFFLAVFQMYDLGPKITDKIKHIDAVIAIAAAMEQSNQ